MQWLMRLPSVAFVCAHNCHPTVVRLEKRVITCLRLGGVFHRWHPHCFMPDLIGLVGVSERLSTYLFLFWLRLRLR